MSYPASYTSKSSTAKPLGEGVDGYETPGVEGFTSGLGRCAPVRVYVPLSFFFALFLYFFGFFLAHLLFSPSYFFAFLAPPFNFLLLIDMCVFFFACMGRGSNLEPL